MYSAFLIMNISDDLKNFDIDKCNERFENFYRLHNLEVDRLTGKKFKQYSNLKQKIYKQVLTRALCYR